MNIHYTRLDLAKNSILLVDTPLPRPAQSAVTGLLLQSQPGAERVGFLEPSSCARMRLQLPGGALCGSTAMALAALVADRDGLRAGELTEVPLEVSGAEGVLRCRVAAEKGSYRCAVSMPRPDRMGMASVAGVERPAVFFPGMVYCIVPADAPERRAAELAIGPLCRRLGARSCGLLFLDQETLSCTTLVYVAQTDTARWQRSCGCGSAALGAWLAHRRQASQTLALRQVGGTLDVSAVWRGRVTTLAIAGSVGLGPCGTLSLPISGAFFTKNGGMISENVCKM